MSRTGWLLAFVSALFQAGCSLTRSPAMGDRGGQTFTMSQADWPDRVPVTLEKLEGEGSPKFQLESGNGTITLSIGLRAEPLGRGWVVEQWIDAGDGRRVLPISFDYASWRPGATPVNFGAFSASPDFHRNRNQLLATADYHQSFVLTPPEKAEPVGLVLHAFSLSQGKSERDVTEALRRRGWAILRTHEADWNAGATPKRERSGTPDPPNQIGRDPEAAFAGWSGAIEQFLADYAYGAEAAVAYSQERIPSLRGKPVVVMGFSLGAILAPTVAARLGDQTAAVVLVGGGADVMGIAANSLISEQLGVASSLRARLGSRRFDELSRARLDASKLDPYATAPLLRGTPVLVIHAAWDSIVPARYGRLLWERLGRPERWAFLGGHVALFWNLGNYAERIADWVDGHARPAAPAQGTPPAP